MCSVRKMEKGKWKKYYWHRTEEQTKHKWFYRYIESYIELQELIWIGKIYNWVMNAHRHSIYFIVLLYINMKKDNNYWEQKQQIYMSARCCLFTFFLIFGEISNTPLNQECNYYPGCPIWFISHLKRGEWLACSLFAIQKSCWNLKHQWVAAIWHYTST